MNQKANTPEELLEWIAAGAKPVSKPPVALQRLVRPRQGEWITLEKLKRYASIKQKWLGKKVRIYSEQWRMWWRENGNGYTDNESEAWVTTFEHAWDVSHHAGPEKQIKYQVA